MNMAASTTVWVFLWLLYLFLPSCGGIPKGVNGGVRCLGCTAVVSLNQQLAEYLNTTFEKSYEMLCSYLPPPIKDGCYILGDVFLPIIKPFQQSSPDVICHAIDVCYTEKGQEKCQAYPKRNKNYDREVKLIRESIKQYIEGHELAYILSMIGKLYSDIGAPGFDICTIGGVGEICKWLEYVFGQDLPILDVDDDRFSGYESLRGFAWRGKDCNDFATTHYPGRKPHDGDLFFDSNCNGIRGFNLWKWKNWEDLLCSETQSLGTIVLGDSIAAHFHIPAEWLTATKIGPNVFNDLLFVLQNEFDWPMMSGYTGYIDATKWPDIITGPIDSVYKHVVNRNRCNHRDYQNIGKNGADSFDMNNILIKALARNQSTDQPALVFYSLFGNDVCHSEPHGGNMTTPEDMRKNAMETLETLDKMLPKGSHVAMLGLADGRILYETMHNRIHPIGALRKDVTYGQLYNFMNCLQVSPCAGWLNDNETIRNATTKRAKELSNVLRDIAKTQTFDNFDVAFIKNFFEEVIQRWLASGKDHEIWQLIEPVGGFHPDQNALALSSKVLVDTILKEVPHFLGEVNPNNHIIKELFGDQGGYN